MFLAIPALAALPAKEDAEWCDIWIWNPDKRDHPHVLLIGDSITKGYSLDLGKKLAGKAYVSWLVTSRFVGDPLLSREFALVLDHAKFDIIHFNNGLHGLQYDEQEYSRFYPKCVMEIRKHAPGAKLVLATTTPVRQSGKLEQFDARTERVKA